MSKPTVILGSRGSKLALWQTEHVRSLLQEHAPEFEYEIKIIHTKGDKILDVALSKIGDKGLFTKELERALLSGEVDLCVHSLKDMPTQLPEGLIIGGIPARANSHDAVVSAKPYTSLASLPEGSRVATGSLRRVAQLKRYRPDIELCEIRGNIDSRVKRVMDGEFDAAVLACAGLERLGMNDVIGSEIDFDIMIPAVAQGAIAVEIRGGDERAIRLCSLITHEPTRLCVEAERTILRELEGGCQVPLGAHAQILNSSENDCSMDELRLDAFVSTLDGATLLSTTQLGTVEQAQELAQQAVADLLAQGAEDILKELR